jgi:hypothetical protein
MATPPPPSGGPSLAALNPERDTSQGVETESSVSTPSHFTTKEGTGTESRLVSRERQPPPESHEASDPSADEALLRSMDQTTLEDNQNTQDIAGRSVTPNPTRDLKGRIAARLRHRWSPGICPISRQQNRDTCSKQASANPSCTRLLLVHRTTTTNIRRNTRWIVLRHRQGSLSLREATTRRICARGWVAFHRLRLNRAILQWVAAPPSNPQIISEHMKDPARPSFRYLGGSPTLRSPTARSATVNSASLSASITAGKYHDRRSMFEDFQKANQDQEMWKSRLQLLLTAPHHDSSPIHRTTPWIRDPPASESACGQLRHSVL